MKWSKRIVRLAFVLTILCGVAAAWTAFSPSVQASPSDQCSPPPPICTFDPKTGRTTCTKVCQSTPAPRNTPPAQSTPPPRSTTQPTQPPRSTSQPTQPPSGTAQPTQPPNGTSQPTRAPNGTGQPTQPPVATGTPAANSTALLGTPIGTATPCGAGGCATSTPIASPTPTNWKYVSQCYANGTAGPPGMDASEWSNWQLAAEGAGYGGVRVGTYSVFDGSGNLTSRWFVLEGFCLPQPAPTPSPTPTTPPVEPPCAVNITGTGVDINCGSYYNNISASADVPCMEVDRSPAPRGLVAVENRLWLVPGAGENGNYPESWSETCWPIPANPEAGKPYNYRIGVRWKRLTGMPPAWDFNERDWNVGRSGASASGMAVAHTYETASYGLAANGPALDGSFTLPAYQVSVHTYWVAEWADAWEYFSWECPAGKERDDGNGPYCTVPEIRVWHDAFRGWFPLDLRRYRNPTYYFDSRSVESPDVRVLPPRLCASVIPVPIIESQSVIGR